MGGRTADKSQVVGVPIKALHEAEGHIVTIETIDGQLFRGKLMEAEDNMNCQLKTVSAVNRQGKESSLEIVFIRGSKIRFIILPDMLKNAPMFRRINQIGGKKGSGLAPRAGAVVARFPQLNRDRAMYGRMRGRGNGRRGRGMGRGSVNTNTIGGMPLPAVIPPPPPGCVSRFR